MPPDRSVRWRTADGRSGRFTAGGPPARRSGPTTPARPVRSVRAAAPPPPPAGSGNLADLRARLGMPASATDEQVIAATIAALPASASTPAPVVPLAVVPAPVASGPTAELLEAARYEEIDAALFGLPLGPATAALAAMGAPTPEQARSDAYAAAERAQAETFARNAEADRLAQVAQIDAARGANARVSAEDRAARERAQDLALFPELGR